MSYKLIKQEIYNELNNTNFTLFFNKDIPNFKEIKCDFLNFNFDKMKHRLFHIGYFLMFIGMLSLILVGIGIALYVSHHNENFFIMFGIGGIGYSITMIGIAIFNFKCISIPKKIFNQYIKIFNEKIKENVIKDNYNEYPDLLKMCAYSTNPNQWKDDNPNSIFKIFTHLSCDMILQKLFLEINKYYENKLK